MNRAKRAWSFPSGLIDHLRNSNGMDGFVREPPDVQAALAEMLWMTLSWQRRHQIYTDAIRIGYREINNLFGSGVRFNLINRDPCMRYFAVLREQNGPDETSSFTRGFRPMPEFQAAFDRFLSSGTAGYLLTQQGKVVRTVRKSIAAKDVDGNKVVGWVRDEAPLLVPVDLGALYQAKAHYRLLLEAAKLDLLPIDIDASTASWNWRTAAALILLANSQFPGHIAHHYVQSRSGRLYASGINLQTCPRALRKAALRNRWDYDIACCHYAILTQMARRAGVICNCIDSYVADKRAVRQQAAEEAGITGRPGKRSVACNNLWRAAIDLLENGDPAHSRPGSSEAALPERNLSWPARRG